MAFTGVARPRPRRRRLPRLRAWWIAALAAIAVIGTVATIGLTVAAQARQMWQASSSAPGSDLGALQSPGSKDTHWTSVKQGVGAWVQTSWTAPRTVNRVRVTTGADDSISAARLTFSDGSNLLLAVGRNGRVDTSFPARTVSSVRLTVSEVATRRATVALASLSLTDDGEPVEKTLVDARGTASSVAPGTSAAALVDGSPLAGRLGAEWRAAPGAATAVAGVRWKGPAAIAAIRVWGPTASAFDAGYSAAAALNGSLRFSDGSTVRVSGIDGGAGEPTTIAFTPRVVSGVTLHLAKTIPESTIGLRALTVYPAGRVPAPSVAGTGSAVGDVDGAACDASTPAVGTASQDAIGLICPAFGARVEDSATVRVTAPAGSALTASIATGGHSTPRTVGTASADGSGTAALTFDVRTVPRGPFTVVIGAPAEADLASLHLQLVHVSGPADGSIADGRSGTLVWDEEFDRAPALSDTGRGATYATLKPEYWGGSQFGDAVFDTPDSGAGTFSTVDGALRIRTQPIGDRPDPGGHGRQYLGGLLSSLRVGATGFSAQYGYYEARMMAPAGRGTWPAFWMMNDDSATKVSDRKTEVDAIELYGHDTSQTCHSVHDYVGATDDAQVRCIRSGVVDDWADGWHTYGVRIEPGRARFYIDHRLVMTTTDLAGSEQPFFFMADMALGGGWPVDLAPTGGRADLWIDYIRVYV